MTTSRPSDSITINTHNSGYDTDLNEFSDSYETEYESHGEEQGVLEEPSDEEEAGDSEFLQMRNNTLRCPIPGCQDQSGNLYYCDSCGLDFCGPCWDKQAAHILRATRPGGIPHEKTSKKLADTINNILSTDVSTSKLQRLHFEDRRSRWFGVVHRRLVSRPPADGSSNGCHIDQLASSSTMYLRTSTRFQMLMDRISENSQEKYPSIVSFVGETGAGKSTLIRALIEIGLLNRNSQQQESKSATEDSFETPVVGTARNGAQPCSGDVHLYLDPRSADSATPILFADCEGINGGTIGPVAERYFRKFLRKMGSEDPKNNVIVSSPALLRRHLRFTMGERDRRIQWATTDEKQTRKYAVQKIYPRFLYAFSDTIVFVTKNAKTFETVLEQLIEWAESALEYSTNQPTLPSVLIVFNAVQNSQQKRYWDPEDRTRSMFRSINEAMYKNPKFIEWSAKWARRGKTINTVAGLVLSYYNSVKIVSVPEKGRPLLIHRQFELVYGELKEMSDKARVRKKTGRMLLKYQQLQPYLNYAFDHLTISETAFNFVEVSFQKNPIRQDFEGGILQFLIAMLDYGMRGRHTVNEPQLIADSCCMIASSIMLNSVRDRKIGPPEHIFPNYLVPLRNAFDKFREEYYPCEFTRKGERCSIIRSRHVHNPQHQSAKGTVIGQGAFCSSLDSENVELHFRKTFDFIYGFLQALFVQMNVELAVPTMPSAGIRMVDPPSTSVDEKRITARIHQDSVLSDFFHKSRYMGLCSNAICVSCITEIPRYPLICGHTLCEPCLRCYGESFDSVQYKLHKCPLCETDKTNYNVPMTFNIPPPEAAPSVLSLDGGGVRGIIQLEALQQIEAALGLGIPIREFFDLIVGTSCGGIIAMGLGINRWSVEKCTTEFTKICETVFRRRLRSRIPGWNLFARSMFETKLLEDSLKEKFGTGPLLSYRKPENGVPVGRTIAVAVTAISEGGQAYVFGNYNRKEKDSLGPEHAYSFYRPKSPRLEMLSWEAARVTSAAPTYFEPYLHSASKLVLMDGGLCFNNPIEIAGMEWQKLMPGPSNHRDPDILVSIGTGYTQKQEQPRLTGLLGAVPMLRAVLTVARNAVRNDMDSNGAQRKFMNQDHVQDSRRADTKRNSRVRRINLELASKVRISDWEEIPRMKELASTNFQQCVDIRKIANQLVASLFYFRLESVVPSSLESEFNGRSYICKGSIRCRLMYQPRSCCTLVENFQKRFPDAHFSIRTSALRPHRDRTIPPSNRQYVLPTRKIIRLTEEDIKGFCRANSGRSVWEKPVEFTIPDAASWTRINFCKLRKDTYNDDSNEVSPISGFPRYLVEEFQRKQQVSSFSTPAPGSGTKQFSNAALFEAPGPVSIAAQRWAIPSWSIQTELLFRKWKNDPAFVPSLFPDSLLERMPAANFGYSASGAQLPAELPNTPTSPTHGTAYFNAKYPELSRRLSCLQQIIQMNPDGRESGYYLPVAELGTEQRASAVTKTEALRSARSAHWSLPRQLSSTSATAPTTPTTAQKPTAVASSSNSTGFISPSTSRAPTGKADSRPRFELEATSSAVASPQRPARPPVTTNANTRSVQIPTRMDNYTHQIGPKSPRSYQPSSSTEARPRRTNWNRYAEPVLDVIPTTTLSEPRPTTQPSTVQAKTAKHLSNYGDIYESATSTSSRIRIPKTPPLPNTSSTAAPLAVIKSNQQSHKYYNTPTTSRDSNPRADTGVYGSQTSRYPAVDHEGVVGGKARASERKERRNGSNTHTRVENIDPRRDINLGLPSTASASGSSRRRRP